MKISRRQFLALSAMAAGVSGLGAGAFTAAGRRLDFEIGDGFGDAGPADIKAVLLSAAETIWQHCPNTRWEVPGFYIFHRNDSPICLHDHRSDGRIAIGLTTRGRYWSQFAFQFAHEFCHALAGHSNDWRKTWLRGRKANHWLEESICEAASLFALRAMSHRWQTAPPYPNWKDYSPALAKYTQDRLEQTSREWPAGNPFLPWFRENEEAMRQNSALREKNNVVARQLLPLFENQPAGWESVAFYNLGKREPEKSLAAHFADWRAAAPEVHRGFIGKLAAVFDIKLL